MGDRGPQGIPTNLKVLHGNPGKRPINENEPKFNIEDSVPKPLQHLSTYAKKEWNRLAPTLHKLGLLTVADYAAFGAYCQSYHRWIQAEKIIRTKGLTTTTDNGNVVQRPEVGIANTSMKLMKEFMIHFGLTPSSRASLHIVDPEGAKDAFAEFKNRKKSNTK